MPTPSIPKAILFDWDNTLVDSWPVIRDALNTTLVAFDHDPWTMEETRKRVRKSLRESFPDLFGDKWEQAADVFYSRYGDIHAAMIKPIAGVSEMLVELSSAGIYLGVVSNKTGTFLRKEADTLDWTKHFGHIIGANDAPRDKPASDPVHLALEGTGLVPSERVWFVGDADIDLECAIRADCVPVLMRSEPPEANEFSGFPPQFHFDTAEALCKRLRKL